MYPMSPGRPTDIGLQQVIVEGQCFDCFCFTFIHFPSPLPLSVISFSISSLSILPFSGRQNDPRGLMCR